MKNAIPIPFFVDNTIFVNFSFSFPVPIHHHTTERLDEAKLGGGNVEGIDISSEAGESLLGTVGADQGVDLDGVNVVKLLKSQLNLSLVGLDIDDEDEGVLLLDLLKGTLGIEGVDDDLVLVEAGGVGDRLAGVLGGARQLEGLGAVEGGAVADLGLLVGVDLERGLDF